MKKVTMLAVYLILTSVHSELALKLKAEEYRGYDQEIYSSYIDLAKSQFVKSQLANQNLNCSEMNSVASTLCTILYGVLPYNPEFNKMSNSDKVSFLKELYGKKQYANILSNARRLLRSNNAYDVEIAIHILGEYLYDYDSKERIEQLFWSTKLYKIKYECLIYLQLLGTSTNQDVLMDMFSSIKSTHSCGRYGFAGLGELAINNKLVRIVRAIRMSTPVQLRNFKKQLLLPNNTGLAYEYICSLANRDPVESISAINQIKSSTTWFASVFNDKKISSFDDRIFLSELLFTVRKNYRVLGVNLKLSNFINKVLLLDDLHLQKNALYTLSFFLKKEQLNVLLEQNNLPNKNLLTKFWKSYIAELNNIK